MAKSTPQKRAIDAGTFNKSTEKCFAVCLADIAFTAMSMGPAVMLSKTVQESISGFLARVGTIKVDLF